MQAKQEYSQNIDSALDGHRWAEPDMQELRWIYNQLSQLFAHTWLRHASVYANAAENAAGQERVAPSDYRACYGRCEGQSGSISSA